MSKFTDRECRIWDAAYAAAFARGFNQYFGNLADFQNASGRINAEYAADIADLAVMRLREWQECEDPNTSHEIREQILEFVEGGRA